MSVLALLAAASAGSIFGCIVMGALVRSKVASDEFANCVYEQLQLAFRAGFMTAADIVTMEGQEELAGKLRRTAETVRLANDKF